MNRLRSELTDPVRRVNPALLAAPVGVDSASVLLVIGGGNPEGVRSEASFAAMCEVPPIEASSGSTLAAASTPPEIQRCLKHHTACEINMLPVDPPTAQSTDDLRPLRPNTSLSLQSVADHFNVSLTTISRTERAIKPNYEFASRYSV